MVRVPVPKQIITREKTDAFVEPSRICVFTKRPGEPTTRKILLPGDIGGVDIAWIFSYFRSAKNSINFRLFSTTNYLQIFWQYHHRLLHHFLSWNCHRIPFTNHVPHRLLFVAQEYVDFYLQRLTKSRWGAFHLRPNQWHSSHMTSASNQAFF